MRGWFAGAIAGCAFFSGVCGADAITIDGVRYDGVYVRESDSRYYVQIPSSGQTISAPKPRVDVAQVIITEDKAEREALLREWRIRNAADEPQSQEGTEGAVLLDGLLTPQPSRPEAPEPASPHDDARENRSAPLRTHAALAEPAIRQHTAPRPAGFKTGTATDGYVQPITLDEIERKEALDALLRPLNLDYEVREGCIWVSTAERIRSESSEPLEVRTFQLNHAGAETLPKLGLSNRGGPERGTYRGR